MNYSLITRTCGILLILCIGLVSGIPALAGDQYPSFLYRSYINEVYDHPLPYRLFVPVDYDPQKTYPLVIFLHGIGERGDDNSLQLTANEGATIWAAESNQSQFPCFVIAPQCPSYEQWVDLYEWPILSYDIDSIPISDELQMTLEIIFQLKNEFNIDAGRLYLTGLSMGGIGTWYLVEKFPAMFAAAIPVCGIGDIAKAGSLVEKPIWTFHGEYDNSVPVHCTRAMVAAIKTEGGAPRYTEYPRGNHNIWELAYRDPGLVPWTFAQKLVIRKKTKNVLMHEIL